MTSNSLIRPFSVVIPFPKNKSSFDKLRINLKDFVNKLRNPAHAKDRYSFILDCGACGRRSNEIIFAVEEDEQPHFCIWFFSRGMATISVHSGVHNYEIHYTSWTHVFELALGVLKDLKVVRTIEGVSIAIVFPKSD